MNYALVKREVGILAKDLMELDEGLVDKPAPGDAPMRVKSIPDTLDELTYIQEKLEALIEYIKASSGGKDHA